MTRINTNVSSLVAQKTLQRSNVQLQEALTRLSTGLRINVGKDDPAGLIASEALRSDIISVEKAISNSERANQLIATADSALGQVSSLLNDIRGLVSEASNTGALSDDQIAANQLQVDSSLEAIDRIAQITSFQGKRLLDGNLDFITTGVSAKIQDLQVDQANFGTLSQIGVGVDVVAQATQGGLTFSGSSITSDVVVQIAGSSGTEAFNLATGSTIQEIATAVNLVSDALGVTAAVTEDVASADQIGQATITSHGLDNDLVITADAAGATAGDLNIKFVEGRAGDSNVATESLQLLSYTAPASGTQGTAVVRLRTAAYANFQGTFRDSTDAANTQGTLDALVAGEAFDGVSVTIDSVTLTAASLVDASYDHTNKVLHVSLAAAADTLDDLKAAVEADSDTKALFTVDVGANGATALAAGAQGASSASVRAGADGGQIVSTAAEVRTLLNQASGVGGDDTHGIGGEFTVSLVGVGGTGTVADFEEFALHGLTSTNNRLQFLGKLGSKDIEIVASGNSTALGVDLTSKPATTGNATVVVGKGTVADASFEIEAVGTGRLYDNTTVVITDNAGTANDSVKYDLENNTLTLDIDVDSGAGITAAAAVSLINDDDYVGSLFRGKVVDGDGSGQLAASVVTATTPVSFSGGETDPGTLIINLATDANGKVTTTANDLIAFFDTNAATQGLIDAGISVSNVNGSDGTGLISTGTISFGTNGVTFTDANATDNTQARTGSTAQLTVSAVTEGADFNGVQVVFTDTATKGSETFSYDAIGNILTIGIESGAGGTTAADVVSSFTGYGLEGTFSITATDGTGAGVIFDTDSAVLAGGVAESGTVEGAALLGNLDEGDATGEERIDFSAITHGTDAFVSIKALSGAFATTDSTGATSERSEGTDVNARINGIQAVGKGLKATLNTSSLDLSFSFLSTVADGDSFTFNITGGGALFQLGPDVVSNQQARLGIQSVSTATLGGVSGRLFELRSGGAKSLTADPGGAAKVVDEVIASVTALRGRLGAFQKTTLETNIFTLNDTLANLTDAESSIRDADFAAESARLTRAQILVQSGTSVLAIANSNPQNVLALLR